MKYGIFSLFLFVYLPVFSQQKGDKTIIVKGVSFMEVCTNLLDKGYSIDKKDTELQTVKTEEKQYPKFWNAKYRINVRVKDSVAYISGTFTVADGQLFKDDPIEFTTNKKGEPYSKHIATYPFLLIKEFAETLNKSGQEISYSK